MPCLKVTALALSSPLVLALGTLEAAPDAPQFDPEKAVATSSSALDAVFLDREPSESDLAVTRIRSVPGRFSHVRFQQTFGGVPVFEGEAIVHLNRRGRVASITDDLKRGIDLDVVPEIGPEEAMDLALLYTDLYGAYTSPPVADLWVYMEGGDSYLVWRVHLAREDGTAHTVMPVVFVDAHRGDIVLNYENLQTLTGTGVSLYSGTVQVETTKYGNKFYLEDLTKSLGTFDMRNGSFSAYHMADSNNLWDSSSQKAGVDAHLGARAVHDYFLQTFGRNGIDGQGGPGYYWSIDYSRKLISSRVHYGRSYNNAYWSGSYMTYGDGDGINFSPLVTVDIAGHEMTHGITQYEANLTYDGESGALNESMSDVFGSMVEFHYNSSRGTTGNYQIAEQCYTPGVPGDFLRNMANPHSGPNYGYTSDDDPDHYSERYTGAGDSGGVHINSGIANFAFYLLAEGGTHHLGGSMTGIGRDKAAAIWYLALTTYMTSGTNFSAAREATRNAAVELYGSDSGEVNAVGQAWSLCGVN